LSSASLEIGTDSSNPLLSGAHAAAAIGYALLHRERTGKGQYVETSLLDCYFSYHDSAVQLLSASHGGSTSIEW
jgi:crotonobetainyl-CoA:carnitine CoA-transferase CaiB-like acyl-CoA transferase